MMDNVVDAIEQIDVLAQSDSQLEVWSDLSDEELEARISKRMIGGYGC